MDEAGRWIICKEKGRLFRFRIPSGRHVYHKEVLEEIRYYKSSYTALPPQH